jgi:hypothetical protein
MKKILIILVFLLNSLILFSQNDSGNCEPVWEKVTYGFDPGMQGLFCGDIDKDGSNEIVVVADGGSYWYVLRYDEGLDDYKMIWASEIYSGMGLMDNISLQVLDCDLDSDQEILIKTSGKIEVWSGTTLQLENVIENVPSKYALVADADNDGDQELILYDFDSTALFTPATYVKELNFEMSSSAFIGCSNVDDDDYIELIYSDKVAVLLPDSIRPLIKWDIPSDQYARTLIGDVDNDEKDEIISCYDTLKVFDADVKELKYSSILEHPVELSLLADINNDATKEILLSDLSAPGIFTCLNALNGSLIWQKDSMKCWSEVVFADPDNDNINELMLSYATPTSGYKLSVLNPMSLEPEWQSPLTMGPLNFKITDVDGDLDDEIVFVYSPVENLPYRTTKIEVINAITKVIEWDSDTLLVGSHCFDFDIQDIDSDNVPEIILSGFNFNLNGVIYMIDGQSHLIEAEHDFIDNFGISGIKVNDIDSDQDFELIHKSFYTIEILNSQDFSLVKSYPDCGYGKYLIGNVDNDESKEIINLNDNIYFIDVTTDEITKTTEKGFSCISLYDFENDGIFEVIAGTESGRIAIISYNKPIRWLQVDYNDEVTEILPIASSDRNNPLLIHITRGILLFMTMEGELLGRDQIDSDYGIDVSDQDGNKRIFTGFDYKLSEYGTDCFPCFFFNCTITTTPSHNGNQDGSATINVSGGKIPYLYSLDGSAQFLLPDTLVGLSEGEHHVTITDASGCLTNTTFYIENILGFEESSNQDCKIYPVPFSDNIVIELPFPFSGIAQVINSQGKIVLTFTISDLKTEVNLKDLPQGYYFINLIGDNGIYLKEKIVKAS